jgi:hypothetical protein
MLVSSVTIQFLMNFDLSTLVLEYDRISSIGTAPPYSQRPSYKDRPLPLWVFIHPANLLSTWKIRPLPSSLGKSTSTTTITFTSTTTIPSTSRSCGMQHLLRASPSSMHSRLSGKWWMRWLIVCITHLHGGPWGASSSRLCSSVSSRYL